MFDALKKLLGGSDEGKLKPFHDNVARTNALEEEYKKIPDAELKNKTAELKARLGLSTSLEGENKRGGAHPTLVYDYSTILPSEERRRKKREAPCI